MCIINKIKEKTKKNIKTIVLPETEDIKVLKAAEIVKKENFAKIILIGNENKLKESAKKNKIDLDAIEIIDPTSFKDLDKLINSFYELRKEKNITLDMAKETITNNYIYFGTMLVKENYADGLVCGSICTTANTLRPALQIIKTKKSSKIASTFFLVEVKDKCFGKDGCFIYADCGMNQNPTSEELVEIAASSNETFNLILEDKANIALLSHSTFSSSICKDQEKVKKAAEIAKEKYPNINIDGEMQFDAAIIPEVAEKKAPNSTVAGKANTLIFPDLDAGNIAYKITQRLAHANVYGPITQGLAKPINDLSRGCSVEDIIGVIAITALQANNE